MEAIYQKLKLKTYISECRHASNIIPAEIPMFSGSMNISPSPSLMAKERIHFKLAVLLFKCVHGSAPVRLHTLPMNLVVQLIPKLDADFSIDDDLALRPWVISHFRSLRHVFETILQSMSSRHLPFEFLKIV